MRRTLWQLSDGFWQISNGNASIAHWHKDAQAAGLWPALRNRDDNV